MTELDPFTHEKIKALCADGDRLAGAKDYAEAWQRYHEAWKLIPEPKKEWEASTWVLGAIADVCFLGGEYASAKESLDYVMVCPGGLGNPFLHLRLGQCCFEEGLLDQAADELARAYMGAGKGIFAQEDPKYFDFLKTRIKPPASGHW